MASRVRGASATGICSPSRVRAEPQAVMESDIYKWRKMQSRTYNYKYRRHARRNALTNLSFNLRSRNLLFGRARVHAGGRPPAGYFFVLVAEGEAVPEKNLKGRPP